MGKRFVWLLVLLCPLSLIGTAHPEERGSSESQPLVLLAELQNETISPGTARYILRAVDEAETKGAECLVITLDSPGGLLESTRQLVKRFLNSRVCIVVYVYPTGSRAASAGMFITLAAHIAAMAPGTTIGAAHPVSIGGLPGSPDEDSSGLLRFLSPGIHGGPAVGLRLLQRDGDGRAGPTGIVLGHRVFPSQVFLPAVGGSLGEEKELQRDSEAGNVLPPNKPEEGRVEASSDSAASQESRPVGGTSQAGESARETPGAAKDKSNKKISNKEEEGDKRGEEAGRKTPSPMEEKIVNDTVSWARALAEERGRNADWAAEAVRQSASITVDEALQKQVVDLKAVDLSDLLEKIDGRIVRLPTGEKTLRTKGARIERVEMWWGERVLALISHPQVAFLLLIFGFYGILYELYSPGWGIPGTVGLICLLLGFFGLSVLPVNYLGLGLIAIALGLFVAEAFVASFGLLTLAGVICMILGGLMLIESPTGFIGLTWGVVVAVALATAAIVVLLVGAIIKAHRREVLTGDESWIGREAQAKTDFVFQDGQYSGKVYLEGEWWQARSSAPIKQGETCRILRREGLTLIVEPRVSHGGESPATAG
jgi:membrane-bound ClpP family serine protease